MRTSKTPSLPWCGRATRVAATLSLLVLAACDVDFTSPFLPSEGITRFDPPSVYHQWWAEVTEAAGISAPFPSLHWYQVVGEGWIDQKGDFRRGLWFSQGRIYIAEALRTHEGAIKHEMLHELLGGDREHSHPLFKTYGVPPSATL